ncbi:hypothetical protein V6U90_13305 [Micromonospora sp. CPCC 206060]|uniref:hypothetical protein n=1 Tax=Micromonospora sp. CPCC 206060 TaxID=3122406 RepID=UPI002FF2421F
MIPEEDRPPAWLQGYGDIEADLSRMEEFAAALDKEVRQHYIPHLARVYDDMSAKLPDPCDAFVELVHFLQAHRDTQQATSNLVHFFRDATGGLAVAADRISKQYAGADAFAAARVGDVRQALDGTAAAPPPATPAGPGAGA